MQIAYTSVFLQW